MDFPAPVTHINHFKKGGKKSGYTVSAVFALAERTGSEKETTSIVSSGSDIFEAFVFAQA